MTLLVVTWDIKISTLLFRKKFIDTGLEEQTLR